MVRIPVAFDDYPLFSEPTPFGEWTAEATQAILARDSVAFGLHDCYAFLWLDRYEAFLSAVQQLGETETLDELASRLTLAAAV